MEPLPPTCYPSRLEEKLIVTVCELSLMQLNGYYNHLSETIKLYFKRSVPEGE